MRTHVVKTWPGPFEASRNGDKLFEWRYDDRGYELGDQLVQLEWDPATQLYTGRGTVNKVSYMLRGRFGVPEGYCVMGLKFVAGTKASAWDIPKSEIRKSGRK